jgi:predicted small lipoprotein YifL
MKKIAVLLSVLLVVALTGCGKEGPMGPSGSTGATGPAGTNHQYTYTAHVTPVTPSGGQEIACAEVVADTAGSNVSTVIVYAQHSGDSTLVALPGSLPESNGGLNDIAYKISTGKVVITWSVRGPMVAPAAFEVAVTVVNK